MAGFDDIARKANELIKNEKVQKAMRSDKAEDVSDTVLDGAAGFANRITGGKHEDKIAGARKTADDRIGTDHPDRDRSGRRHADRDDSSGTA